MVPPPHNIILFELNLKFPLLRPLQFLIDLILQKFKAQLDLFLWYLVICTYLLTYFYLGLEVITGFGAGLEGGLFFLESTAILSTLHHKDIIF